MPDRPTDKNTETTDLWHIYEIASANLSQWRSFGVKREQIVRAEDMRDIARALLLLRECLPGTDIVTIANECWITECPLHKHSFVCVRPGMNPYAEGYVISPIPPPHVTAAQMWEKRI